MKIIICILVFITSFLIGYLIKSKYYKKCPEWTNLILYTLKNGNDNCCSFINEMDENLSYKENFINYMNKNNQEIL